MGAQLVFDALRQSGLTLYLLDGGTLRATPKEAVTDAARAIIREHKAALVALLKNGGGNPSPPAAMDPHATAPEARPDPSNSLLDGTCTAICGDSIPMAWVKGLAQLKTMQRPADIDPRRWRMITDAANNFETKWAVKAHETGWTTEQVFGCHRSAPFKRMDAMGLVLALAGQDVQLVKLDVHQAVFAVGRTRARQAMQKSFIRAHEGCLLWEIQ